MTLKEADRLAIVKRVTKKELTIQEASRELGISTRQMKRIRKRYFEEGYQGVVSRHRGKPSNNQITKAVRESSLELLMKKYSDYGPTLASEKLFEKHGISLSKETVRKLMIANKLHKPKKNRFIKNHPRRTRRSKFGEMIQIEGSYHDWFEDRAEKCCLIVFVDDATSCIPVMRFCNHETTEDYLKVLRIHLERHGRPCSLYSDKHSVFRVNRKNQHDCNKWITRFHEVLQDLDIELICAHSPQAKGRVERANGVLQDRLIKEMRENNISSIEEGNQFLDGYIELYNFKFAVTPANPENAHRSLLLSHDLDMLMMQKEKRKLSKDLSFQYKNEIYQIDSNLVHSLRGKEIEVYERDGEIKLILQSEKSLNFHKWTEKLAKAAPIVGVKELEAYWPTRKKAQPSRHHPWR